MGQRLTGQILALAIGLAPVVLLLFTWSPQGPKGWMIVLRTYPIPVLATEVAAIIVGLLTGLVATITRIRLPKTAAFAAGILGLVMIGTVPFAPKPQVAATYTAIWGIHIFFGLSVLHLSRKILTPGDLVRGYAIGFAIFCSLFFILLTQASDPAFDWSYDLPAFSHVRIAGHYAAPVAGFAAGMMAAARTSRTWAAAFLLAWLALVLALWTGSRAALVGVAGGLGTGLFFARPMRMPRAWGGLMAALAVAWFAVSSLPVPSTNMGPSRIVSATVQSDNRTTGRTELWAHVAKAVAKRPAFGYGEAQMVYVAKFANLYHPHNIFLQILLAWGVVGLICVATLTVHFLRWSIPVVRSRADDLIPPFIAMAALAIPSIVDGSLFHVLPVSIFAACAGMIGSGMQRPPADR